MAISSPYISFPGNAAEAFAHYAEVFGGTLELYRYGDMPPMEGMPFDPPAQAVAHAALSGGFLTLAGGDAMGPAHTGPSAEDDGGAQALASDVYSILVTLSSVPAAEQLIARLVEAGGRQPMPFDQAPWGDHYGQVVDRFGVLFAFVVPGEQSGS